MTPAPPNGQRLGRTAEVDRDQTYSAWSGVELADGPYFFPLWKLRAEPGASYPPQPPHRSHRP